MNNLTDISLKKINENLDRIWNENLIIPGWVGWDEKHENLK